MVKNLRQLECKFDPNRSEQIHHMSMQMNTRHGQTELQVDPTFQLASTCKSVWPGLIVFPIKL